MPGFTPADGEIIRVTAVCSIPTQIGLNTTYYVVTSHIGAGCTLQEIGNQFQSDLYAPYRTWLGNLANFFGVRVQNVSPPATIELKIPAGGTTVGTGGPFLMSTQVSGLIRFRTLVAGKAQHGRIYPPFPPSNYVGPVGNMNATGSTNIALIAAAYPVSKVIAVGGRDTALHMIIRHGPRKDPANPTGPKIPPLTPYTLVDSTEAVIAFATQRRRGDFGRENAPNL